MIRKSDQASGDSVPPESRLSRATVARLSLYLRRLESLLLEGTTRVSSGQLGEPLGVSDAQVRKDLGSLGGLLGQPGIGYSAQELVGGIRRTLGIDRTWRAALVGLGNLARALLRFNGFADRGFQVVALFDQDPNKVGQTVANLAIHPASEMNRVIAATGAELGIITVPAEAAQGVAESLVGAGVRGLLNFAPGVLRLPSDIQVVSVDLAVQLEQLAFLVQEKKRS